MKVQFPVIIFLCCCALLCVSASATLTVVPPIGIPSGDLVPDTHVTIETTITDFFTESGTTFPGTDTLQFYTDLDSPKWNIALVLNSIENPRPVETSRTVRIPGFELEYPSTSELKVRVSLEGVVPDVTTPSDKTIIRIRQLDSSDNVRSGGEYIVSRLVSNPESTPSPTPVPVPPTPEDIILSVSGDGSYYLGDKITLTGTNTASNDTYFFLTGPNLPSHGVNLTFGGYSWYGVLNGDATTFTHSIVNTNKSFEYIWDTSRLGLDAGTYTIYAAAHPYDRNNLADTEYDTVLVEVRRPYLSATLSQISIQMGESLSIKGTATGNPTEGIAIWIFGPGFYLREVVDVNDNATYEFILNETKTAQMYNSPHFVVIQHPMTSWRYYIPARFDVLDSGQYQSGRNYIMTRSLFENYVSNGNIPPSTPPDIDNDPSPHPSTDLFIVQGSGRLHGCDAAEALIQLINNPNCGDTYVKGWFQISDSQTGYPKADIDTPWDPHPATPTLFTVEKLSGIPTGDFTPGTSLIIYTSIKPNTLNSGITFRGSDKLQLYTDLNSPVWRINITINGIKNPRPVQTEKSFVIPGFELEYPSSQDVKIEIRLEGDIPLVTPSGDWIGLGIRQLDSNDKVRDGGEFIQRIVDNNIYLSPGWNFISVPNRLDDGRNTAGIFLDVNTLGRSILLYNTSFGQWDVLNTDSLLQPLDGIWIYSNETKFIPLSFESGAVQAPPSKQLYEGWNAIGLSSTIPVTARDTLITVSPKWGQVLGWNAGTQSYDTAIIRGGSGAFSDTREMQPMQGYWIAMTEPGVLYALS